MTQHEDHEDLVYRGVFARIDLVKGLRRAQGLKVRLNGRSTA